MPTLEEQLTNRTQMLAFVQEKLNERTARVAALEAELAEARGSICMGVGDGSGQLFVYGNYESIKAAQAIVADRERLTRELTEAREEIQAANVQVEERIKETVKALNTADDLRAQLTAAQADATAQREKAEVAAHMLARAEAECEQLRAYKEAIDDLLVVSWELNSTNATDPRKAIHDLIACAIREAADPAICEEAAKRQAENNTLTAQVQAMQEALEAIAESRDAGRHDGHPEPCPAHDAETMHGIATQALATLADTPAAHEKCKCDDALGQSCECCHPLGLGKGKGFWIPGTPAPWEQPAAPPAECAGCAEKDAKLADLEDTLNRTLTAMQVMSEELGAYEMQAAQKG